MPKIDAQWRSIGPHKVALADCAEVDPPLADALVTDPPFGIGFKYASHEDSEEGYGAWLWGLLEKYESKLRPGSPVFVWQAMPNIKRFTEWFPREWRIFAGVKNFVQMRPCAMQYAYDPILVWWTPGSKPWAAGTATR